ncbi:hypothetical protein [Hymenobacter pini]|uniref:hypothetical protein n=1 Tax=Hymenobacter pini TaxID=2880879 RepID=UPI001CF348A1|nr:hypothetical protein [Hymenobacter pini]MCA8830186.1 hypothetical protein [Hymenobacter pini]
MLRLAIYFALLGCLLASCASERLPFTAGFERRVDSTRLAQAGLPVPTEPARAGGLVVLQDVGKKNTFIIQTAPGNTASTTKTDNTGRNASEGANGGHAVVENRGPGFGTFAVVAVVGFAAGFLVCRRWLKHNVSN